MCTQTWREKQRLCDAVLPTIADQVNDPASASLPILSDGCAQMSDGAKWLISDFSLFSMAQKTLPAMDLAKLKSCVGVRPLALRLCLYVNVALPLALSLHYMVHGVCVFVLRVADVLQYVSVVVSVSVSVSAEVACNASVMQALPEDQMVVPLGADASATAPPAINSGGAQWLRALVHCVLCLCSCRSSSSMLAAAVDGAQSAHCICVGVKAICQRIEGRNGIS